MSSAVRNLLVALAVFVAITGSLVANRVNGVGLILGLPVAFFVWFIAHNLSGNRAVSNVPPAERDLALRTPPPPGHGLVYIYRDGILGMALGCNVTIDGTFVAQLKSPRFTRVVLPAGNHTLETALKSFGGGKNNKASTGFTLAPGVTLIYFTTIRRIPFGRKVVIEQLGNEMATFVRLAGVTMVAPDPGPTMVPQPPVRY